MLRSVFLELKQGEQRWRSGESTRLPPMWPGFKSRRRRHMWVEFVVGSLPCSERFPGTTVFPSPQKPTFPNSNSTKNQVDEEPLCGFATCKSLFIYLFIYLVELVVSCRFTCKDTQHASATCIIPQNHRTRVFACI